MKIQERIDCLNAQIKNINNTCYPDGYEEVKVVMIQALQSRVQYIRHNERHLVDGG